MATIAHISDLHFGRELPRVIDSLTACLDRIDADLVVISGDLTQRARTRQFCAARDFLAGLSHPYLIVPGNHDLPTFNLVKRFRHPWKKWRRFVSDDLQPTYSGRDFKAVGINTARRLAAVTDWSRGRINRQQIQSAMAQFRKVPDHHLRLLVAHHPFWLPAKAMRRHLIGGRDAALALFRSAGGDMILSGHVHLAYLCVLEGIVIVHAGTTTSNRLVGQANSFNLIRGDRQSLWVDRMVFDNRDFKPQARQHFVRQDGRWTVAPADRKASQEGSNFDA